MLLNLQTNEIDLTPFFHSGIIIDTSVFKIMIDGMISTRISKKRSIEFEQLTSFLDLIKMNNKWEKYFITPHVLTETCTHLRNDYRKWHNYKEIIEEIIPIIKAMNERSVKKDLILDYIDIKNPIVELGDISVCLTANDFISRTEKIAILACDNGLSSKYQDSINVIIMDFKNNINNLL